jgi:hypothetical protein
MSALHQETITEKWINKQIYNKLCDCELQLAEDFEDGLVEKGELIEKLEMAILQIESSIEELKKLGCK